MSIYQFAYASFVVHLCLYVNHSVMATKKLTLQERSFLITRYYSLSHNLVLLQEEFEEHFRNTAFPSCQMLHNMHRKFPRTGSVTDAPQSDRPYDARTMENQYAVA